MVRKVGLGLVVALVVSPATSSNASPYSDSVLADNPVSYWRLGDSGSPGVDEVGGRNLGYQGTPLPGRSGAIAGDPNTATGFLGDRSALSISFEPALNTSQFSIESWVNISGDCENTLECNEVFVASRDTWWEGYFLQFHHSPTTDLTEWVFAVGQTDIGGGNSWGGVAALQNFTLQEIQGDWHHLVGTYDGNTARLYLNGSHVGSRTQTFAQNVDNSFSIGRNSDQDPRYPLTGAVDEVAYYNYALSGDRISAHYQTGIGVIPEPSTALLLTTGLLGLGPHRRRRGSSSRCGDGRGLES